jgi:dCTP deaminase
MILTHHDLVREWRGRRIRFDPNIDRSQIGLSSIDLRLGYVFTWLKPKAGVVIKPAAEGFQPTDLIQTQDLSRVMVGNSPTPFKLHPGDFVLGQTLEGITIPNDLVAQVQGRSSLARSGLSVHATAPHINPGWVGKITLELLNSGPWELEFDPGTDLVCQVIFQQGLSDVPKKIVDAISTFSGQVEPWPAERTKRRK